jgi:cytochrome c oxidase accessory protein FixG
VYTELFQWLELRTEGDRQRRLRLDRSAWTADKVLRRGSKHLLWALLSLWTGLTFVGYFTPVRDLFLTLPLATGSWEAFWILFYAAATYFNAGYLRESVCQHMCPYGRFQGSLMDSDTLYVAYDHQRPVGRCVDCTVCVQVCPVGIDIRQGLQAACISCGLCIDACNQVMDKLNAPRGLIRLASEAELSGLRPRALTLWAHLRRRRVRIYGGLLLLAVVVVASAFAQRSTLRVNAMRDRGVMARTVEGGAVENVYRLQVMNAQDRYRDLQVEVRGQDGLYLLNPVPLRMLPAQAQMVTLTVRLSAQQVQRSAGQVLPIQFAVSEGAGDAAGASGGRSRAVTASTFIVD